MDRLNIPRRYDMKANPYTPKICGNICQLFREFTRIENSNEDSSKHVQVAYKKSQEIEQKNGMK